MAVQVLVGMLGMLQGSDPFLVYPQRAAHDCPGRPCLSLPEDAPPPSLTLFHAPLDSSSFFVAPPKGTPSASRPGPAPGDSSRLRLSGSKSITSSVSSNGVLLQQEMLLDVNGEPTPGLAVKAHLSDKDAPLGSSGSTSSLRQTDEVWIDARSRRFHGRIGDLSISPPAGLLGTDTRSARGLSVELGDSSLRTWSNLAGNRSQWIRRELNGITGIQEGYSLTEGNASRALVPGTEKVWLDGILLQRGSDYELRPADGVLDFLPSRRILSSSRIVVEVQAADRDYEGSIASGGIGLENRYLGWETWAFRAADDPAAPLSYAADTTTRRRLAEAGSDTSQLRTTGASHIPLPASQVRTGMQLHWNRFFQGSLEGRLTRTDANLASSKDTIRTGGAFAGEASKRLGSPVTQGGTGIWNLAGTFQTWQKSYSSLRAPIQDTSQGGWSLPTSGATDYDQEHLDLGWEAIPSLGLRLQGRHFYLQDWGDMSSGRMKVGFEQDSSHIFLLSHSLAHLDQGKELWQSDTRFQSAWEHHGLEPSLQASIGERNESRSATGTTSRTWLDGSTGLSWQRPEGGIALRLHARREGNDFGTGFSVDSSRSLQTKLEAQLQNQHWNGSLLIDRLDEEARPDIHSSLEPATHWLAETRLAWIPIPTGLKLEGHYRLSTAQWRPSLAIYDTVSIGTGKYRFDSASNEIVSDEFGNLILAGTRLDSLHPARQSGNVLLTLNATLVPKEINPNLSGLIADLSTQLQMELEQVDSSQNRIVPDYEDRNLARSILGRSRLDGQLWWTHKPWRGQLHWERTYKNSIQNWSYICDQEKISTEQISLKRSFFGDFELGSTFGYSTRTHEWSFYSDQFEKKWIEPSLNTQWRALDAEASLLLQQGSQAHNEASPVAVNTFSQAFSIGWRTSRALHLSGNLHHFQITSTETPASWLTDNYPVGSSWRTQVGLDWNLKESLQASASWILRITPNRSPDQRLDLQAKAIF